MPDVFSALSALSVRKNPGFAERVYPELVAPRNWRTVIEDGAAEMFGLVIAAPLKAAVPLAGIPVLQFPAVFQSVPVLSQVLPAACADCDDNVRKPEATRPRTARHCPGEARRVVICVFIIFGVEGVFIEEGFAIDL
jgi:hypothetical protein